MKNILLISLVLVSFMLTAQNLPRTSIKFIEESLSNNGDEKIELSGFNKIDFSKIWLRNQDAVIGFIGDNYQRINIHLISVTKNQYEDNEYFVYGKSRVKNNVCDFQGKFRITHVREFNIAERETLLIEALKRGDQEAVSRLEKRRCYILAEYFLFEDSKKKESGRFIGVVKSLFYIQKGEIYFDDINLEIEDKYSNNQFVGIYKGYKNGLQKTCNWGAYRIPNAGDLDIGVGEFSPNIRYLKSGWDIYYLAYNKLESEARKKEEIKWWK